jgi:hypothetical protein
MHNHLIIFIMSTAYKLNFIISSLLLLAGLTLTSHLAFAQEELTSDAALGADAGQILANINLSNAELSFPENDREVIVNFLIENQGDFPQFDVRYGLEIIKPAEDGYQSVVDTKVVNETRAVPSQRSLAVELIYDIPALASGTYEVWVTARTQGGTLLGVARAGEFVVSDSDALEVKAETCYLTIGGERFTIYQGIDVAATEDMVLNCAIKNHAEVSRNITPSFATFRRTIYGEKYEMNYPTIVPVELAAGEEREISLSLPKASTPQAYDIKVSYADVANKVESNHVIIHYVLQGESATIQTINFDKNYYRAGDDINLEIFWSESADTFDESRSGGTRTDSMYYFEVTVTNASGQACTVATKEALPPGISVIKLTSDIDCVKPAATIVLITDDGRVLDERSVIMTEDVGSDLYLTAKNNSVLFLVTLVALALALLTVFLFVARRKKIDFIQASKILMIATVFGISIFGSAPEADAVTWTVYRNYQSCNYDGDCTNISQPVVTATVNTDRTTYAPGATITLTGSSQNHVCSNTYYGVAASLVGNPHMTIFEGRNAGTYYFTRTMVAPTTPGTYDINLGACYTNINNCASSRIRITVQAPAASSPTLSGNGCTIPSGGSSCTGRATWSILNASNPNLRNETRSYTYSNSASGNNVAVTLWGSSSGNNSVVTRNGSTVLRRINLVASCIAGTSWNGSVCAPIPRPAVGNFDVATPSTCSIAGWAYDPDSPASSISVHVYRDQSAFSGGTFVTSCSANQSRPDVNSALGISGNHGFNCVLPASYADTGSHNLYIHAIDVDGAPNNVIAGSPRAMSCSSVPATPVTATISGSGCSIPNGASTCSGNVTWNITGATSPNVFNSTSNSPVSSGQPSGTNVTTTLVRGTNTLVARDGVSSLPGSANLVAECADGPGAWTGTLCDSGSVPPPPVAAPSINITVNRELIRSGETVVATVTIDAPYPTSCTLYGVETTPITFSHSGTPSSQDHNFTTRPLTAAQEITVTCEPNPANGATTSAGSARVNVIPAIQEI